MTIVEIVLALGLFAMLMVGVGETFGLLSEESETSSMETELTAKAFDGVNLIARDIRQTGRTDDGVFPYLFSDPANPGAGFDAHAHAAPRPNGAGATNREVIFLLVADDDEDGIPDIELTGELNWHPSEISYVLVPGPKGRNQIERRIDGAFDRLIARDVESLTIDDWWTSGSEVPLSCLRIRAVFAVDSDGVTIRRQVERTVRMMQEVD
ncbi:MAG: hypothetical protein WD226_01380 [Planctomycetota bacterium]